MAKSENQKLKLLYIVQMLLKHTDEDHVLGTQEIIDKLAEYDIRAERKSIYDDMMRLADFGFDVLQKKGRGGGYYLASRDFETAELKLLVDAVQASRFMTEKKSRELIKKLENLTSRHQAVQLQHQVVVVGRVKTENEKIYYNVDSIYKAIDQNVKISFTYLEWNLKKELTPRRDGEKYVVSPWFLIWEDENYYLAAFDEKAGEIRHYRVDKMGDVILLEEKREGKEQYEQLNPAEYTKQTFGMFGGERTGLTLQFPDKLIGVVIDRFGRETDIKKLEKDVFTARVKAAVSGQLFGWLAGLGGVKIVAPAEIKEQYIEWLNKRLKEQE